jgi:hypothetical protein
MSNTWSVSLAPEASSEARAPDAMRSSARPRLAITDWRRAGYRLRRSWDSQGDLLKICAYSPLI